MSETTYTVKPGYSKGGKGRFTKVASPCRFEFTDTGTPMLHVLSPAHNTGLFALCVIPSAAVGVILREQGWYFPPILVFVGLGVYGALWGFPKKTAIDLSQAHQIILNAKKKEIGILCTLNGKQSWISVVCGKQFDAISQHLKDWGQVSIAESNEKKSPLPLIIRIVVYSFLVLAILFVGLTVIF